MVMWVFGYGSLIWKAGFRYDERLVGFIWGYRRVFYQGSTDHRGTPAFPGRTVTLEAAPGEICIGRFRFPDRCMPKASFKCLPASSPRFCHKNLEVCVLLCWRPLVDQEWKWGVAYKISEEDEKSALEYLEVREKQYDMKVYLDFFTDTTSANPAVSGVMVYVASPDKELNKNYLGPASIEDMASQIVRAQGPSGPNREYLFQLERALVQFGCEDTHVRDLANAVRKIIAELTSAHLKEANSLVNGVTGL